MCQMCDEYENELVRMGLIEDARKFREEREREHKRPVAIDVVSRATSARPVSEGGTHDDITSVMR